jgi:hypothetical protein
MWFDEGLDQLGQELMDVIGTAVVDPPIYKNYVLCTLFGLFAATLLISSIVLVRLCINKHRKRSVKENALSNIRNILKHPHHATMSHCHSCSASQPMLPKSAGDVRCESGFISTESSRLSTASHSRNTSTGSSTSFQHVHPVNVEEGLRLLLDDPDRTLPNV